MIVRVGIYTESYPPFYDNCVKRFGWNSHKDCRNPGLSVEILRELFRLMNASVEFVLSPWATGLIVNKSSSDGVFGAIMNETFHTSISDLFVTNLRVEALDFSTPIVYTPYVFFYKLSDDSLKTYLTSLLRPFSKTLWILLSTVIILLLAAWIIVSNENITSILKIVPRQMFIFVRFLQGDYDIRSSARFSTSKIFFFVSLNLFITFFSGLYQGVLLISFIKSEEPVLFSKFSELIQLLESNRLEVVTDTSQWGFFEKVQTLEGDVFGQLKNIFSKYNYLRVNSEEEVFEKLMTGKFVYPTYDESFRQKYPCDFGFVELAEDMYPSGFVFRKNSSLVPLMNSAIARSWQMINHYTEKYKLYKPGYGREYCPNNINPHSNYSLSIYQLVGSFVLLLVGYTFASCIFLFEISRGKCERRIWIPNVYFKRNSFNCF